MPIWRNQHRHGNYGPRNDGQNENQPCNGTLHLRPSTMSTALNNQLVSVAAPMTTSKNSNPLIFRFLSFDSQHGIDADLVQTLLLDVDQKSLDCSLFHISTSVSFYAVLALAFPPASC